MSALANIAAAPEPTALDRALETALVQFPEGRVSFRRTSIDTAANMRWSVDVATDPHNAVTGYHELPSVALDHAIAEWRSRYPNPGALRSAEIERLRLRLAALEGVAK